MNGKSSLPKLPGLLPEDHEMYYGMFSFPNLMLNLHPDCGMYYIVYPNGPGRSTVISGVPVPAGDDREPGLSRPSRWSSSGT